MKTLILLSLIGNCSMEYEIMIQACQGNIGNCQIATADYITCTQTQTEEY